MATTMSPPTVPTTDPTSLKPSSIAGACISILFSFFTVAVLACFRDRCQAIMIKQQFALSIMVTNVIVVVGLQSDLPETSCRVVTVLLLYSVVASFAWLVKDIAYMVTCIKWELPLQSFRVVCLITWGLPIPCLGIGVLLGELLKHKMGFKVYNCWQSDHIVWAWIAPCLLCVLISFYCVVVIIEKLSDMEKRRDFQKLVYISADAIKYNLTTNIIMLVLNIIVWVSGALVFYHSDNKYFQLMLGLTDATQGLVLFFVYCVFHSREKGIYSLRELKVPIKKRVNIKDVSCSTIPEEEKGDTYAFKSAIACEGVGKMYLRSRRYLDECEGVGKMYLRSRRYLDEPAPDEEQGDGHQEGTMIYSNENIDDIDSPHNDSMADVDIIDAPPELSPAKETLTHVDQCVASPSEASDDTQIINVDSTSNYTERRHIHSFEDFINASMTLNPDRVYCQTSSSSSSEEDNTDGVVKNEKVEATTSSASTSNHNLSTKKLDVTSAGQMCLTSPNPVTGFGVDAAAQCQSRNSAASFSSMNELEILFNNPEILNGHYPRKNRFPGQELMKSYHKPPSHRHQLNTYNYPTNNSNTDFVASWSERANIDRILHENIDPCIKPENKLINTKIQHTNLHINDTSLLTNHQQLLDCNQRNDVIVEVEESHSVTTTPW